MISRRSTIATLALLVSCGLAAADDFPNRPITFVVPFPPGGGIDVTLRAMAPKLQERLGKPVLVENRAGGSGNVAALAVAKSAPDGHTLFAAPSTLAANPKLYKTLPFDTLKDFAAVSLMLRTPYFLVLNPSVPATNVPELVALLKQKPGAMTYAHSGPGSSLHLAAELFQAMTGTSMTGVGYRGAALGLNDVMANHVPLMFVDTGTALAQIEAGKVRALGVSSTSRIPAAPNIPTLSEAGVPGFDAVGWLMVVAPSGTPRSTVGRLAADQGDRGAAGDSRADHQARQRSGRKSHVRRGSQIPGVGDRALGRDHREGRRRRHAKKTITAVAGGRGSAASAIGVAAASAIRRSPQG